MPDNEIVINIKNTVDVTNQNKPKTAKKENEEDLLKKKSKKTEEVEEEDKELDKLLVAKASLKYGSKIASLIGIDTSSIQKIASYGFATQKAISGLAEGSYGGAVMLALQAISMLLEEIKSIDSEMNSLDEAKIKSGVMDVSNKTIRARMITGRYTYNRR